MTITETREWLVITKAMLKAFAKDCDKEDAERLNSQAEAIGKADAILEAMEEAD